MANILYFSNYNPVQFYKDVPDSNAQFNSRLFDNWYFANTILDWEQRTKYEQPWQRNDTIQMQLQANYNPIVLEVIRASDDAVIDSIDWEQIRVNYNDPSMFIYEIDVALNAYPVGCYYFKIKFGSPVILTLRSELICLQDSHPYTILVNFKHYKFFLDFIFETGFSSSLRIPATLKYKGPASIDTIYKDQVLNPQQIRSVPFNVWNLNIGGSLGIPDYLAEKIYGILGSSDLQLDGKFYSKDEGATMEPNEIDNYPMRGWKIQLLPKYNRTQRVFENESMQNALVVVMANSDSKGFSADPGSNETVIIDVF